MKKIIIGSDKAGVDLKNTIAEFLKDNGIDYEDVGVMSSEDETKYPLVAEKLCEKIIDSDYKYNGILICGTGIGMSISANKFKGIHSTVCHDVYSAERAKLSNNTNVISLGQRVIGPEAAKVVIKRWLELDFKPSHSSANLEEIVKIEDENFKN